MFLRLSDSIRRICRFVAAGLTAALVVLGASPDAAQAQAPTFTPSLLSPGDAVVTGFSGIVPPAIPPVPPTNPLDVTFINMDGTSMQIERLQPNGPPAGQLIPSPAIFSAYARDVGQVFATTFDDALSPNIYLGATSIYGLNIVAPDATGALKRIKIGQVGAKWMDGQWGTAKSGTAGSIYKVDGATGNITLFTTIGANSGAGLGDVVYDRSSRQFFVSDLDTGRIYRLDATGLITDSFDHGVAGRPLKGLLPVADDGSAIDISSPAFNTENPATWGYTQKERVVWGLAVYYGRLFYAVNDAIPQIWSIGINLDGTFAGDPRWELDVADLASNNPVSDIVFDREGRMILAQRGQQRGSYDYSVFAEPLKSSVVRYTREIPDNPATPGTWVPTAEQYAIGFPPDRHNANGGISLGYRYDQNGYMRSGSCGEFLWSTGESLRDDPALAAQLAAGGPAIVDGLQGNDRNLVRPQNDPPFNSYFTDFDSNFDHPEHKGWMGDVEIYQPCQGGQGYYIPPYYPPGYTPPPTGTFNLTLDKEATPKTCLPSGADWLCYYTVRVTNTGSTIYWGPLSVRDWLPANPPGATMTFDFQPPWNCNLLGPTDYQCDLAAVLLFPGESVDLYVTVKLPQTTDLCFLDNAAQIVWWPGYGDQNPGDDIDFAQAQIPNPKCQPSQGPKTNLKIEKRALTDVCLLNAGTWDCFFLIRVTNLGGIYNGPIVVSDTVSAPAVTVDYALKPNPPAWSCAPVPGAAITCTHAPVVLLNGQAVNLLIRVSVPVVAQADAGKCTVQNEAKIVQAAGGTDQNFDSTDDSDSAEAKTPGRNCEPPGDRKTDLSLTKHPRSCVAVSFAAVKGYLCHFGIIVKNESLTNSFAGPLTVHDVFTPGGAAAFGAGWTCVGGAGTYDCTLNPGLLPMGPGATRVLTMTTFVPPESEVCKVDNTATISNPVGGSDANTDSTNDSGSATDTIPSDRCQPPATSNIKIEKTAGACTVGTPPNRTPGAAAAVVPGVLIDCAYTVTLRNLGPSAYNGNLGFLDAADVTPRLVTITPNAAGWICSAPAPLAGCGYPGIAFANNATATFNVHVLTTQAAAQAKACKITNGAAIFTPLGFPSNTVAGDDVAFIDATVPANLCPPPTTLPQQIQACPTDRMMPGGGCCPEGQTWNGRACSGSATPPPPPPPPPGKCPSDSTGTYPNCTCKAGSHGVPGQCLPNVCPPGTTGTYPNCTTAQPTCPPGFTGTPPNCRPPTVQVCPSDSVGTFPNCRCKPGTNGNPGACKPNVCPPGTVGKWPTCVTPQVCPSDSVGTFPNCRCKPGTNGNPGACKPNVCPPGTIGQWPTCVTPQVCPSDSVGTFPNCRCKPGTSGNPGACKPNVCPAGTTGVWPNCVQIPSTKPTACPSDSSGIPPNCRCKPGTTGTPGKCVRLPTLQTNPTLQVNPNLLVPLKCPAGTTGTPPNCIQVPR